TVNRYSGLVISAHAVTVDHVLDLAEIPTAQRSPAIDTSGDGTLSSSELTTWATSACAQAAHSLRLTVADQRLRLTVTSSTARTLPGQAGLPILRLECAMHAAIHLDRPTSIMLADTTANDEVGWREMTARGDGTTLTRSDAPTTSRSARLTAYPKDLLTSPLDIRSVAVTVKPGGPRLDRTVARPDVPASTLARGADRLTLAFEGLLASSQGHPLLEIAALLAALALGAAHAVAPGHGKTIMAFYLSGRREGALRSAATVGATVTATHTAGVLALGLLISAGTTFVSARLYPWLGVVSGLLVAGVGLSLLRNSARSLMPVHRHPHPHPHPHGSVAAHVMQPESLLVHGTSIAVQRQPISVGAPRATVALREPITAPAGATSHSPDTTDDPAAPSRRGLVAIGLAGGLLPSPSALLVLLGSIALGHPWFGVAMVVSFGLGMAATLAMVGLFVLHLRERAERRLRSHPTPHRIRVLRYSPVVTASVVLLLGAALAGRGLIATGMF
ncbi:MAG: nickel/cobalt transporter (NicO) family protein, partial [Actinomycetota bacterium]|nr:nickel/cobalt transporter (NicO) family protein [Actinomycetota bacterium]